MSGITVNGRKIPIYTIDSPDTIIERIAVNLNTLPKYLVLDKSELLNGRDIQVRDLLQEIKMEKEIPDVVKYTSETTLNPTKDVIYVWLAFNENLDSLVKKYNNIFVLNNIKKKLVELKYFSDDNDFLKFWKEERENSKRFVLNQIASNKLKTSSLEKMYSDLDKSKSTWIATDFQIEKVNLELVLNTQDMSLLELFNSLVLNINVPFAYAPMGYYKILKDYTPHESWVFRDESNMILKVSNKETETRFNPSPSDFVSVVLYERERELRAQLELIILKGNLDREAFSNRILSSLTTIKPSFTSIEETGIFGIYYYSRKNLNSYVFADLVMNDPIFSYMISIDESVNATKKKSDSNFPWIYIHFNHITVGNITASITQSLAKKGHDAVKRYGMGRFPIGKNYIRVKVKNAKNIEAVNAFMTIFSKLLTLYDSKYDQVVKEYREFIPDFATEAVPEIDDIDMSDPANIAPEIFVNTFSRSCKEARKPTIIDQVEVEEYQKKGQQVMKFPRDVPEDGKEFPSDGVKQHYYVCNRPGYAYPGLQDNRDKLSNSNEYPVLPCCFESDQTGKPLFVNYFQNKKGKTDLNIISKKQQDFIKTEKMIGHEIFGSLPKNIEKLFNMFELSVVNEFRRVGVDRNHSSLISCVLCALYKTTKYTSMSPKDRLEYIRETRLKLADTNTASLCKQSMYDVGMEDIQNSIRNTEVYFDPRLYTQLLEEYFNVNIYVFDKERMIIPKYMNGYYTNVNKRDCIFIYEHWGSESDHAKYPQCEIIFLWVNNDIRNTEYIFSYNRKISRVARYMFNSLVSSYSLNSFIQPIQLKLNVDQILSQCIDTYGKCRLINVLFNGEYMSLLTSPIPPLQIKAIDKEEIHKVSIETAVQFINKNRNSELEEEKEYTQYENNGLIIELGFMMGNVSVFIPVINSKPIPNVSIKSKIQNNSAKQSMIGLYNYNKKMARYLTEYMYWLFSRYMSEKEKETITDKLINKFVENNTVIIPNFEYKYIPKTFSTTSNIMKDEKLVVQSEEMLKRLIYVLKLYSIRDIKSLLSYKNRPVIQHYYKDITDFTQYSNQVILYGNDSIEKWIYGNNTSYVLTDSITIGKNPYFFRNTLISDTVYLAQNATSLENALLIGKAWREEGYNLNVNIEDELNENVNIDKIPFVLYSYINNKDITIHNEPDPNSINILGYKIKDIPFYTVLLEL